MFNSKNIKFLGFHPFIKYFTVLKIKRKDDSASAFIK